MTDEPGRRDCTHQRVHHRHGTRAAYVADHCHCIPCTQANRVAAQRRRRAVTHGTWRPYRSSHVAARHVRRLLNAGMTITDIAAAAAVARSTISSLAREETPTRIRTTTHLAVLSVDPPRRPRVTAPTRTRKAAGRGAVRPAIDGPATE